MSLHLALPARLDRADLTVAMAWNSFSETLSSCSLPGMQLLSTSGSLSFAQTTSRLAASWTCPFMVIAIGLLRLLRSRYKALAGQRGKRFHAQALRGALRGVGGRVRGG